MPTSDVTHEVRENSIYRLFEIGIILKGLDGVLEIILGLALLFTNVTEIVQTLVQNELIEDPNGFFVRHLHGIVSLTPHAQYIGALYLLSHGIVKAFLSVAILRNKFWAYPAGMTFFGIFALYEFIRFFGTQSLLILAAALFDTVVVLLIWHEYRRIAHTKRLLA
jgi:uncharacterized membrane protein